LDGRLVKDFGARGAWTHGASRIDELFGTPAMTRSWNTVLLVLRALNRDTPD
jgi:hypothetical protein